MKECITMPYEAAIIKLLRDRIYESAYLATGTGVGGTGIKAPESPKLPRRTNGAIKAMLEIVQWLAVSQCEKANHQVTKCTKGAPRKNKLTFCFFGDSWCPLSLFREASRCLGGEAFPCHST
jgi:hypothetical protein